MEKSQTNKETNTLNYLHAARGGATNTGVAFVNKTTKFYVDTVNTRLSAEIYCSVVVAYSDL